MNKFSYRIAPGMAADPLSAVWPKVHAALEKDLADVDAHVAFVSAKIDFPNVAGSYFAHDFDPAKYGGSYMSRRWTKAIQAVFANILMNGPDRIDLNFQFEIVALPQKGADKGDLWRDHLGRVSRHLKTDTELVAEAADRAASDGEALLEKVKTDIAEILVDVARSKKEVAAEQADRLSGIERALTVVWQEAVTQLYTLKAA